MNFRRRTMFHCLQAQVNEDEDEDDVFKLFKTKSGKFSRHRHRLGQTGRFLRGKQQIVCLSRSRSSAPGLPRKTFWRSRFFSLTPGMAWSDPFDHRWHWHAFGRDGHGVGRLCLGRKSRVAGRRAGSKALSQGETSSSFQKSFQNLLFKIFLKERHLLFKIFTDVEI